MGMAPDLIKRGVRIIDLGADFRIKDVELWSTWYKLDHTCPDLVEMAVYGLPEVNRDQIKNAQLIACPG